MIEKFGFNQKPLTDQDWNEIAEKMKVDPHIRHKTLRFVAEAEHQSQRFVNLANLCGPILFLAFLKFPMIRVQPGWVRVGAAGSMAYPFYAYLASTADKLRLKRSTNENKFIKFAFRRHLAMNNMHHRVSI